MFKVVLKYGGISGIIVSGLMLLSVYFMSSGMDYTMTEAVGYSSMVFSFFFIFWGIKTYREELNQESFSFLEGFKVGLGITTIASIMYVITWMFYYDPESSDMFLQMGNEAQGDSAKAWMELYNGNALVRIGITLMEIFPVGFLISLVFAFILKRKG